MNEQMLMERIYDILRKNEKSYEWDITISQDGNFIKVKAEKALNGKTGKFWCIEKEIRVTDDLKIFEKMFK